MKPRVYIETTIPSYLTASESRDPNRTSRQLSTREWWERDRLHIEAVISQTVTDECDLGDPNAAALRLASLTGLRQLVATTAAAELANDLIVGVPFPERAARDALHIATAAIHGVEYLLTWNCTHLANARLRSRVEAICLRAGYKAPIICTPDELRFGGTEDDGRHS